MDSQIINTLQETHLALWNEKDGDRRKKLIKTIYADDIKMYDQNFILNGAAEVYNFITKLITDDPNFYFSALQPMEATQNGVRLFWTIQTNGISLTGMDFFILEEGLVTQLYVFMNAA